MSRDQEPLPSDAQEPPPAGHGDTGLRLTVPASTIVAAVLGLLAAWIAAGSIGLTGHALRAGLTWLAMGGVLLAVLRRHRHRQGSGSSEHLSGNQQLWALGWTLLAVVCGAAVAVAMTASRLPAVNVLAIPVLLAVLAATEPSPGRVVLKTAAEATFLLALYRLAVGSLPAAWLAADNFGDALGLVAGEISGCPLWIGATFAGVDFLVVILYVILRTPFAFAAIQQQGDDVAAGEGAAPDSAAEPVPRATLRWWAAVPIAETVTALLLALLLHLAFLIILTYAARWQIQLAALPPPDPEELPGTSPREFVHTFRNLIPWNLPVLAALFHSVLAAGHWWWWSRRLRRFCAREDQSATWLGRTRWSSPAARIPWPAAVTIVVAFAVAVPLMSHPGWRRPVDLTPKKADPDEERADLDERTADLNGKKVVVLEEGYLNWSKPVHGDYGSRSIGMYGMLPVYLESLGAECVISSDLSDKDLRKADLLLLIYPDKPWQDGQLERIWQFVREGGSLLVMGEHTIREPDGPLEKGGSRFNEVLEPTAMRVRFDSATFEVGGWLQSYQALAHPTSAGIGDARNDFGVVIGASVDTRWPARPLLVGRWGWADPGDVEGGPSMMGNNRYDPGERLGDLVLAAEQPLGKGKVIAFGDTSGLTNGLTIGCHTYTSRLFAYAAERENRPLGLGWQLAALFLGIVLAAFVAWRREAWFIAAASVACGLVLVIHTAHVHAEGEVLPDADRLVTPYDLLEESILEAAQDEPLDEPLTEDAPEDAPPLPSSDTVRPFGLAYLDASHLHAYSPEGWRDEGTMGLCLTLLREGYLTLMLPEVTEDRLQGASLLVSIAPSREYSRAEQEAIEQFVREGGTFIYTIGRDHYAAGKSLLERLRFRAGFPNWDDEGTVEPIPCSHFKTPYFEGEGYEAYVRFHAAWPVACLDDPSKRLLVTQRAGLTPEEPVFPLIEIRRFGKGLVVVIGDTAFATNQNLEREDGEPFEGLRENAHFWRWLLVLLRTGEVRWVPPADSGGTAP